MNTWEGFTTTALRDQHGIRRVAADEASAKEAEIRTALASARRRVAELEAALAPAQDKSRDAWEREDEVFTAWLARLVDERTAAAADRATRWSLEPAR